MNKFDFEETRKLINVQAITFYSNSSFDPSAYLRVRGPMHHLGINVIEGKENDIVFPDRVSQGDIVVIQRDFARDFRNYEKIVKQARLLNKPIIYDLDDLLFLLPENHPDRISQHYTASLLPIMQTITEADCVTVTTNILKDQVKIFNNNVEVLPNFFDDFLWTFKSFYKETEPDEPIIIGFMGTESHKEDIRFISPILLNLIHKYSQKIEIHFWGAKPSDPLLNLVNVKHHQPHTYNYVEFSKYFQKQNADIFIAPLIDNQFNRAKSHLKFLEYSALGAPTIFSNLEPFNQIITHGENGYLAKDENDWMNLLIHLIEDHENRQKIALNAQSTITEGWLLSKNAVRWKDVYENSISKDKNHIYEDSSFTALLTSLNNQYSSLIEKMTQELDVKDGIIHKYTHKLEEKEKTIQEKNEALTNYTFELNEIKISKLWKLVLILRGIRLSIMPPKSKREKIAKLFFHSILGYRSKLLNIQRIKVFSNILEQKRKINNLTLVQHEESIDIIVCVHNALDDIKNCLDSIKKNTSEPYTLIIVDDGSNESTKTFLETSKHDFSDYLLIRNDFAKGYTLAANIGLRASRAKYKILLNSDTIVGPEWIDRMYRAIILDGKIGLIGPLSNTASWQSIPELSLNGDWASNPLPSEISVDRMSQLVAKYSGLIYPEVPLLNGFCLMIKQEVIDQIGFFDEENFSQGYGEEDDFTLRAEKLGWKKAIADDVYIYHAQSKSYSNEKRYQLSRISSEKLRKKHGIDIIQNSVSFMNPNRILEGIRSRSKVIVEREDLIDMGKSHFSGKTILFLLPVADTGGGANVIIDESRCMRHMGVEVKLFNLSEYKIGFNHGYPNLDIPVIFGDLSDLPDVAKRFDAVIASANYSVEWLRPLQNINNLYLGYYIQGYEPLMYPENSEEARKAMDTYTLIPGMKKFVKTDWTQKMIYENTGAEVSKIGISVNIDLFRPRDPIPFGKKPVTIVAMIRPGSPYRNPELTLSVLREISKRYKNKVKIFLFGANDVRTCAKEHFFDFEWNQLGKLTQYQVASMMSKADIFTDFSSHQAMGLSALEAMASGCCVLVPQNGGAIEFIHHKINGIVVDSSNLQDCVNGLDELVGNDDLRELLQLNGLKDVVRYFPEKPGYNILNLFFND